MGRPSQKPLVEYKGFLYQAAGWKTARRVVAKGEDDPGEWFPRRNLIVTNLTLPSRAVVRFYNKRGTAEPWIKEGKQAVKMTRLSCHRFRSNEVRLWLSIIAYNLGNLWRRLVLPQRIGNWSLTSLQQRLVKTGGRLVKHARYYWLLLAESHLTRRLFASMLGRTDGLSLPSGWPRLRHLRNRFRYPPGRERCLKKLVLEAEATGFQDPEKGGWEPVGPSGRKNRARRARLEATGVYTRNRRRVKKLIPAWMPSPKELRPSRVLPASPAGLHQRFYLGRLHDQTWLHRQGMHLEFAPTDGGVITTS